MLTITPSQPPERPDDQRIRFEVQVFLIAEGEQTVAYCPALELSTYGDSPADAAAAFEEVLHLFVEDTQAKGTLERVLLDLGWRLQRRPQVRYEPPAAPLDFLNTVGAGRGTFQTLRQPVVLAA